MWLNWEILSREWNCLKQVVFFYDKFFIFNGIGFIVLLSKYKISVKTGPKFDKQLQRRIYDTRIMHSNVRYVLLMESIKRRRPT